MSDWQKGDLALCVEVAEDAATYVLGRARIGLGPIRGLTYTVSEVRKGHDCYGRPGIALKLCEIGPAIQGAVGYNAECFRKITPGADIEGIEEPRRVPVKEKADA